MYHELESLGGDFYLCYKSSGVRLARGGRAQLRRPRGTLSWTRLDLDLDVTVARVMLRVGVQHLTIYLRPPGWRHVTVIRVRSSTADDVS